MNAGKWLTQESVPPLPSIPYDVNAALPTGQFYTSVFVQIKQMSYNVLIIAAGMQIFCYFWAEPG